MIDNSPNMNELIMQNIKGFDRIEITYMPVQSIDILHKIQQWIKVNILKQ